MIVILILDLGVEIGISYVIMCEVYSTLMSTSTLMCLRLFGSRVALSISGIASYEPCDGLMELKMAVAGFMTEATKNSVSFDPSQLTKKSVFVDVLLGFVLISRFGDGFRWWEQINQLFRRRNKKRRNRGTMTVYKAKPRQFSEPTRFTSRVEGVSMI